MKGGLMTLEVYLEQQVKVKTRQLSNIHGIGLKRNLVPRAVLLQFFPFHFL
jgi:hypothetical protein